AQLEEQPRAEARDAQLGRQLLGAGRVGLVADRERVDTDLDPRPVLLADLEPQDAEVEHEPLLPGRDLRELPGRQRAILRARRQLLAAALDGREELAQVDLERRED